MTRSLRAAALAALVIGFVGNGPTKAFAQTTFERAEGQLATATTFYAPEWQFTATRAGDGDVSTGWSPLGVAQDARPAWTVDLGTQYRIASLQLVTRQDVDQPETRRNFEVRVSNDPNFGTFVVLAGQGTTSLPYRATWTASVTNTNTYRYVRFIKTTDEYFFIAEARVFTETRRAATQTAYASPTGSGSSCTQSAPCSLTGAQAWVRARTASMTAPIDVLLLNGTYRLTSTLTFGSADSGRNNWYVNWRAATGATPVLSGGTPITGWTPGSGQTFVASVPAGTDFRQLYVNGVPAVRATDVAAGTWRTGLIWNTSTQTLAVPASLVSNWQNLQNVEVVINRAWQQARVRIASISYAGSTATITPRTPERPIYFGPTAAGGPGESYRFENAREFVDTPGEFYLDRVNNQLVYYPRAGENMSTAAVIAPTLQELVRLEGTLADPVNHINFDRITFAHSNWLVPSNDGLVVSQGSRYKLDPNNTSFAWMPAAVVVRSAKFIDFRNVTWFGLGVNGLNLYSGAQQVRVERNTFTDIAGSAMNIDADPVFQPADARSYVRDVTVKNSTITRAGSVYTSSPAIIMGLPINSYLDHNAIFDIPYSGISVGFNNVAGASQLRNVYVRYNDIGSVVRLHDDGGGIYSQNPQPGSIWSENYVHDITRSQWTGNRPLPGLYFDNLSANIIARDNVIQNLGPTVPRVYLQTCCGGTSNITLINNDGNSTAVIDNAGPLP